MEPATFAKIVDGLIDAEGTCESIALSGGEPTSHPQILELLAIANRPEIGRVVLITNGIRLGKDRAFAQALKDLGVYIGLQLDGFTADTAGTFDWRGADKIVYSRTLDALSFLNPGDAKPWYGTSNTDYGPNLHGTVCRTAKANDQKVTAKDGVARASSDRFPRDGMTVTTPTYRLKASGRWMIGDFAVTMGAA